MDSIVFIYVCTITRSFVKAPTGGVSWSLVVMWTVVPMICKLIQHLQTGEWRMHEILHVECRHFLGHELARLCLYNSLLSLWFSHWVVSDFLRPHGLYPTRLLCPWDSPGKNTGVGCHFLLQSIFPSRGSNLRLLLLRWVLYCWATWEVFTQMK